MVCCIEYCYNTVHKVLYSAALLLTESNISSNFIDGSGPIFLSELNCSGSEVSILDCPAGHPVGLHHCNHSMDVGLMCQGRFYKLH